MRVPGHILISPVLFALYPVAGLQNVLIAMISSVFIDIDHLSLIVKEKAFTLDRIKKLNKNLYEPTVDGKPNKIYTEVVYLFHTLEFNALLLFFSIYWPVLKYVVIGFIFHIICDIIHHSYHKLPIESWLFLANKIR